MGHRSRTNRNDQFWAVTPLALVVLAAVGWSVREVSEPLVDNATSVAFEPTELAFAVDSQMALAVDAQPALDVRPAAVPPRVFRLPPPEIDVDDDWLHPLPVPSAPQRRLAPPVRDESPERTSDPRDETTEKPTPTAAPPRRLAVAPERAFAAEEFDADAELAAQATVDDVLAYFPAADELSVQLRPQVQAAFTLARNGALFAAQDRFENLLYELARSKDASQMTDRHTRALAAGLRALGEADDFLAAGGDREVNPRTVAAGHQTPVLHEQSADDDSGKWTLAHEAIAMYHYYAQQKLAAATADEPAGSMALFGLGKIYQQLAVRSDDQPQAVRKSLTMYRAAVLAHAENHLAANEAGVLLARAGRYAQAQPYLTQAVQLSQSSTSHLNLAFVYAKQGNEPLAAVHRHKADRLAQQERARGQMSAERGIAWVSPQEFNRRSGNFDGDAIAAHPEPPALQPTPTAASPPALSQKAERKRTLWW